MFVCCECCVLSGRGFCDGLITRPEESYRLWCVAVCDLEPSWMRRPWPTGGCCAKIRKYKSLLSFITFYRFNCSLFFIYGNHPVVFTNKEATFVQLNKTKVYWIHFHTEQLKIKRCLYRPRQTESFPGSWGVQIAWRSAKKGGEVVSSTHRPPLPPKKYSVRDWVYSREDYVNEKL